MKIVLSIIIVLFFAFLLTATIYIYFDRDELQKEYLKKTEALNQDIVALKDKLGVETNEKTELSTSLKEAQKRYDELKAIYAQLEANYTKIADLKNFFSGRIDQLTSDTRTYYDGIETLVRSFSDDVFTVQTKSDEEQRLLARESKEEIKKLVSGMTSRTATRASRAKTGAVELPKVIVTPDKTKRYGSTLRSNSITKEKIQVVAVNEKYNFVVINKGTINGIRPGEYFAVYRNNRDVATIQISEVSDYASLATIVQIEEGDSIMEGDAVVST